MQLDRTSLFGAVLLIGLGVIFLGFNLAGVAIGATWPVVFFVLSAGFFLPAFLWPGLRQGLAGLFIPGALLFTLGLIFLYDTLSGDWASWAYAWLLIPGSVGLGLILAVWGGGWNRVVGVVGLWMVVGSLGVFSLFAAIFGGPALKAIGPGLLIVVGVLLLLRGVPRRA